ncbi:hypothetical protein FE257_011386 [Aspergillus nanangensis]|uniref:Uncharacterized protein n=1 Tax=Aspergillus nanangensis TaxID=2582783 RepID=A0AAD4CHB1_ASPNN|nr:hypothetical protein FE257_011386 [Aspergillus nanangensis]
MEEAAMDRRTSEGSLRRTRSGHTDNNPFKIVAPGPRFSRLKDQIRPRSPPSTDNPVSSSGIPAPSPPAIKPTRRRRIRPDLGAEESNRLEPSSSQNDHRESQDSLRAQGGVPAAAQRSQRRATSRPRRRSRDTRALTPEDTDEHDDDYSRKYKRQEKEARQYISQTKDAMRANGQDTASNTTSSEDADDGDEDGGDEEQEESPSGGPVDTGMVIKPTISEDFSREDMDHGAKLRFLQKKLERNALDLRQAKLP